MSDTRKREIVLLSVPQVEAPAIAYQSQNRQRQSPRRYDDMIHRLPYVGRCLHVRTWVCRTQLHICIFLCLPWSLVLTSVWSGGEIQSHPEHLPLALIRTLKCRICWIRLVLNKASYRRFIYVLYFAVFQSSSLRILFLPVWCTWRKLGVVVSALCFVMWHCQRIDDVCQCKDKMISLNCVCAECFFKILSEKADDNTSSYFFKRQHRLRFCALVFTTTETTGTTV